MKNLLKTLMSVLLVLVCAVTLTACGSKKTAGIAGSYELTSAKEAGTDNDIEQFAMLKEQGMNAVLTLNEDKSGELNMFGTVIAVTWDDETKTIEIYGNSLGYTAEDKTFAFTWEGSDLIFTKAE